MDLLFTSSIHTPLGEMVCLTTLSHLVLLLFKDMPNLSKRIFKVTKELGYSSTNIHENKIELIQELQIEIDYFFQGKINKLSIPFLLTGTEFQKKTYSTLVNLIEFSNTISYSFLSKEVKNNDKARRAIALALSLNPLIIVVPCHRVIPTCTKLANSKTKHNDIGGFSAGIERKRFLLNFENKI